MAHALPPPPGRPRRNRIIGIVCVVVGVIIAAIGIAALRQPGGRQAARSDGSSVSGRPSTSSSGGRSPTTATPTTAATSRAGSRPATTTPPGSSRSSTSATKVPLIVANNTGAAGLATEAAARFQAKGWQVTQLAVYTGGILSTCAYYDPSDPAAQRAATTLQQQFPGIKRVKERFDGLPAAPIVVVLTSDWTLATSGSSPG